MNAPVFAPDISIPEEFRSLLRAAARRLSRGAGAELRAAPVRPQVARPPPEGQQGRAGRGDQRRLRQPLGVRDAVRRIFRLARDDQDATKKLKKWMKPQARHADFLTYPGARNRVIPQPLGVVGVIVPWNFRSTSPSRRWPQSSPPATAPW